jgi:hypothetical protein
MSQDESFIILNCFRYLSSEDEKLIGTDNWYQRIEVITGTTCNLKTFLSFVFPVTGV